MLPDPEHISVIVLLLSPLASCLTSLVKQEGWPKQANQLIAMGIAALGGWLVMRGEGVVVTPDNLFLTGSMLFAAMQAVYVGLKDSPLDTFLATFPGKCVPPPPLPPARE